MATELITPTPRLASSWFEARDEWPGAHQAGTGMRLAANLDDVEGFSAWTQLLAGMSDPSVPVRAGAVHASFWWIVEGDEYLGAIDLRHYLNDVLRDGGGHIGYSVRPSARGRGLASWALGQVLLKARELGLERVLLTCDPDNGASSRVIERNGGELTEVRDTGLGMKRFYWIDLSVVAR